MHYAIDLIINQNVILSKSEKNKDEVDGKMNWKEKKTFMAILYNNFSLVNIT